MDLAADRLLITCEHGGRRVPPRYRSLFAPHGELLRTHRGSDLGALAVARVLADELEAPLLAATVTRLLVDLNRSVGHPTLHSEEVTRPLPVSERREIVTRYYTPHRERIVAFVDAAVDQGGRAIHIASHSFTPNLDGDVRRADVGFLYDPARPGEATLAARWRAALKRRRPGLRLRRNYPYLGDSDGLARTLRRRHPDAAYLGIELEVNQALLMHRGSAPAELAMDLARSLREALHGSPPKHATEQGAIDGIADRSAPCHEGAP